MTITVFTARSIVTMDPARPAAEVVAVEDGRIIAVENRADVNNVVGSRAHLGYHELWHGDLNRQLLDTVSTTRPIGVWQRSC